MNITACKTASRARRTALETAFDMIIINYPLADEREYELPQDLAEKSDASIMLMVPAEVYDIIADRMEKAGIYEKTERQWDLWRNMLRNHLTTCVEDGVNERSDCHAWGALALYELPAVILGVRPGAPGFEKIKITPVPGYLEHAEGSVITKWGTVRVSWKREKGGVLRTVYELPEKYLEAHPEEK